MRRRAANRTAGMTMAEILVVLTIVLMMLAITVPTFARLGLFSGNDMKNCAHEIVSMLTTAKIYAATNRVAAAAAYYDTYGTGACFRAVALVYRHPSPGSLGLTGDIFVPVKDEDGGFREMPGQACLFNHDPWYGPAYDPGLTEIRLFVPSSSEIIGRTDPSQGPLDALYGHVFLPSGRLLGGSRERFRLYVGMTPEADPYERYIDPANPAQGERYLQMELYRAIGRVRLEPEEG